MPRMALLNHDHEIIRSTECGLGKIHSVLVALERAIIPPRFHGTMLAVLGLTHSAASYSRGGIGKVLPLVK